MENYSASLIRQGADLIERHPEQWVRNNVAITKHGTPTSPTTKWAVCFCFIGFLAREYEIELRDTTAILQLLDPDGRLLDGVAINDSSPNATEAVRRLRNFADQLENPK